MIQDNMIIGYRKIGYKMTVVLKIGVLFTFTRVILLMNNLWLLNTFNLVFLFIVDLKIFHDNYFVIVKVISNKEDIKKML